MKSRSSVNMLCASDTADMDVDPNRKWADAPGADERLASDRMMANRKRRCAYPRAGSIHQTPWQRFRKLRGRGSRADARARDRRDAT